MYLDFFVRHVSQNRLNPIMQRAKIDRSVRRVLPVYDNEKLLVQKMGTKGWEILVLAQSNVP